MAGVGGGGRHLRGVTRLRLKTSLGPEGAPPRGRLTRAVTERNFRSHVTCPGDCRAGGFELGHGLWESAVQARRAEARGVLRCKGFVEASRGGRRPCPYTLAYEARLEYAPYDR